jgi:hypothetical protein
MLPLPAECAPGEQGKARAMKSKRSRADRKAPKKIPREFLTVRFEFWEIETPAFQHLSADATRVYLFMKKRYNGSNNGQIIFSHRDAQQALRSGWRRGANALAELEHYGFIKCRNPGEPGPNIRLASEWQLTVFECGGQEASKTFSRWDGTAFEPPYTRAKKQLPIVTVKTPRRHGEDASAPSRSAPKPEHTKSVVTVKTPPPSERRHGEDTCRYTTQGFPENEGVSPRAAPPSAAPCASTASPNRSIEAEPGRPLDGRPPRLVEIPRGPNSNGRRFGEWLEAEGLRLEVPPEYVAGVLGVTADQLLEMTSGAIEWTRCTRRKAEAALASYKPIDEVP